MTDNEMVSDALNEWQWGLRTHRWPHAKPLQRFAFTTMTELTSDLDDAQCLAEESSWLKEREKGIATIYCAICTRSGNFWYTTVDEIPHWVTTWVCSTTFRRLRKTLSSSQCKGRCVDRIEKSLPQASVDFKFWVLYNSGQINPLQFEARDLPLVGPYTRINGYDNISTNLKVVLSLSAGKCMKPREERTPKKTMRRKIRGEAEDGRRTRHRAGTDRCNTNPSDWKKQTIRKRQVRKTECHSISYSLMICCAANEHTYEYHMRIQLHDQIPSLLHAPLVICVDSHGQWIPKFAGIVLREFLPRPNPSNTILNEVSCKIRKRHVTYLQPLAFLVIPDLLNTDSCFCFLSSQPNQECAILLVANESCKVSYWGK